MKIEEIYENWKSLFPLSEAHVELLRNKFTTEYNYKTMQAEATMLQPAFLLILISRR